MSERNVLLEIARKDPEARRAIEALGRECDEARAQVTRILAVVQHYQPPGSPPPGGPEALAEWVLATMRDGVTEARAQLSDLRGRFYRLGKARDEAIAQRDALARIGRRLLGASYHASVGDNPEWHAAISDLYAVLNEGGET